MTQRWSTPELIAQARARFEAAIPGFEYPSHYAVGKRVGDGVEFFRVNSGDRKLPAVILATVCGHVNGSASYTLDRPTFQRAVELLEPAEADTSQDHPNVAAWRRLRDNLADDEYAVAVFDAEPELPTDDADVLALRAALRTDP